MRHNHTEIEILPYEPADPEPEPKSRKWLKVIVFMLLTGGILVAVYFGLIYLGVT